MPDTNEDDCVTVPPNGLLRNFLLKQPPSQCWGVREGKAVPTHRALPTTEIVSQQVSGLSNAYMLGTPNHFSLETPHRRRSLCICLEQRRRLTSRSLFFIKIQSYSQSRNLISLTCHSSAVTNDVCLCWWVWWIFKN